MKNVMKKIIFTFLIMLCAVMLCETTANAATNRKVKEGETWYSISREYGVTAEQLAKANGLTPKDTLVAGKTIKIPTTSSKKTTTTSSTTSRKVKKGETWYSISKEYGLTASQLAQANGLTPKDTLVAGKTIKIPTTSNKKTTTTSTTSNKKTTTPSSSTTRKVKKGETWYSISKEYGLTASQLAQANGLTPKDTLVAGKTIKIPRLSGGKMPVSVLNNPNQTYQLKFSSITLSNPGYNLKTSWVNVTLVANKLDGLIIYPNKTFSYNNFTDDINYVLAPVFENGKKTTGKGGGACFVSTTLMQAVRKAGCTILEKHDHSLPVAYATRGNEASVARSAGADFRFINNSNDQKLVIRTYLNDKTRSLTITCTPSTIK